VIRKLRKITERKLDAEPTWRHKGRELTTGYSKAW
jgi:hydrogenase small subunit